MPGAMTIDRPEAGQPRIGWIVFLLLGGILGLNAWLYSGSRIDDVYILLRYARNLSEGHGLVFNPGEHVEGFTSPAMVFFQAALMRLHLDAEKGTRLLDLLGGLALVVTTLRLAPLVLRSWWAVVMAGLLVAIQPSVGIASWNGLETAPFAACVLYALYRSLVARSPVDEVVVGVLLSVATFLRPEGALAYFLAVVHCLWRHAGRPGRWRSLAFLLAPGLIVALPLYLWKAAYFQALVPNTAIAKVPAHGDGRLASGLIYFLEDSPGQWELVGLVCLGVLAWRSISWRVIACFAVVWGAYVIATGGDWMPVRRFLVPVVPAVAIGLAAGLEQVTSWIAARAASRAALARVLIAAVCFLWLAAGHSTAVAAAVESVEIGSVPTTVAREPLGRWLRQAARPDATVGIVDVGAVGYYSGIRVMDLTGLTDASIAQIVHQAHGMYMGHHFFPTIDEARAVATEALSRRPEFFVLSLMDGFPADQAPPPRTIVAVHTQDQALKESEAFRKSYRYICSFPEYPGLRYSVFARSDVPNRFRTVKARGDELCELNGQ